MFQGTCDCSEFKIEKTMVYHKCIKNKIQRTLEKPLTRLSITMLLLYMIYSYPFCLLYSNFPSHLTPTLAQPSLSYLSYPNNNLRLPFQRLFIMLLIIYVMYLYPLYLLYTNFPSHPTPLLAQPFSTQLAYQTNLCP